MTITDQKRLKAILDNADELTALRTKLLGIAPTPADSLGGVLAAGVTLYFPPSELTFFELRLNRFRDGFRKPVRWLSYDVEAFFKFGLSYLAVGFPRVTAFGMGAL